MNKRRCWTNEYKTFSLQLNRSVVLSVQPVHDVIMIQMKIATIINLLNRSFFFLNFVIFSLIKADLQGRGQPRPIHTNLLCRERSNSFTCGEGKYWKVSAVLRVYFLHPYVIILLSKMVRWNLYPGSWSVVVLKTLGFEDYETEGINSRFFVLKLR